MAEIDYLKKKVEGRWAEKKRSDLFKPGAHNTIDMEQVDKIVSKMKKKYKERGVELEEVGGRLNELRGIIAEGKTAEVEIQSVEDLAEFKSPLVKRLGGFYLKFGGLFRPLSGILSKLPFVKQIDFYLYSANMRYSAKQFIALATVVATLVFFAALIFGSLMATIMSLPLGITVVVVPLMAVVAFLFTAVVILLIPKRKAQMRGDSVSKELPFALRHMATELRAGIGLYRTIQAIATAGYGDLSEEFARTIGEIEEGTDTQVALRHLALRTQSRALRNALMHIIRALKTGGNLSEIMNEIAGDVAFELRMKMRDFAEKMNFFGVIFIFAAIVLPVFVAILGGIRNTPLTKGIGNMFEALPLSPEVIALIYLVLMPFILIWLLAYILMAQPKV